MHFKDPKRLLSYGFSLLLVIGLSGLTTFLVFDRVILTSQTYIDALYENNAFSRIYTEVLAEPRIEERFSEIFEKSPLAEQSETLYGLLISTIYLVLPPEELKRHTEARLDNFEKSLKSNDIEIERNLQDLEGLTQEELESYLFSVYSNLISQFLQQEPDLESIQLMLSQSGITTISLADTSDNSEIQFNREEIKLAIEKISDDEMRTEAMSALEADQLDLAAYTIINAELAQSITAQAEALLNFFEGNELMISILDFANNLAITEITILQQINKSQVSVNELRLSLLTISLIITTFSLVGLYFIHRKDSFIKIAYASTVAAILQILITIILTALFINRIDQIMKTPAVPESAQILITDILNSVSLAALSFSIKISLIILIASGSYILIKHARQLRILIKKLHVTIPTSRLKRTLIITSFLLISILSIDLVLSQQEEIRCNGLVEICEKPINEVVFAGTHNSMSIAEYGWLWPSHDGNISRQLNFGIRSLLIDTHYFDAAKSAQSYLPDANPAQLALMQNIIDEAGLESREGTFLCHLICHIGYTPLESTLAEIKDFLDENPHEIILIIFEDKISFEDKESAIWESGLDRYLYRHDDEKAWPKTLDLIKSDQRLILMSENHEEKADWYLHAWTYGFDTPFSFPDTAALAQSESCQLNRGSDSNSFFLINHWVERVAPSRTDAVILNDIDFLRNRVDMCYEQYNRYPSIVAINFYLNGDILELVNELNRR